MASDLLERALSRQGVPEDFEILNVLDAIDFYPTDKRDNIRRGPEVQVLSETVGLSGPRVLTMTKFSRRYPSLFPLLSVWARAQSPSMVDFTSIQVNKDLWGARHRDTGNRGTSLAKLSAASAVDVFEYGGRTLGIATCRA